MAGIRDVVRNNMPDWIWCHDVIDTVRPEAAEQIVRTIGNVIVKEGIVLTWRSAGEALLNPRNDNNMTDLLKDAGLGIDAGLSSSLQRAINDNEIYILKHI